MTKFIDPRKVKIPNELLTEPAHTCHEDNVQLDKNGCPPQSCTIINSGV